MVQVDETLLFDRLSELHDGRNIDAQSYRFSSLSIDLFIPKYSSLKICRQITIHQPALELHGYNVTDMDRLWGIRSMYHKWNTLPPAISSVQWLSLSICQSGVLLSVKL